uniref:Uncharacterized protein n=1 Tax=Euglena mutabilis TaxID=38275 RepID=A0A1B0UL29_EUGMU|nr:hypothetical protein [Euglena mutabilis]
MLFSLKIIKRNKFIYYPLMTNNFGAALKSFPSISLFWLKKTSFLINKSSFLYQKKTLKINEPLFQLKKLIIEVSFIICLNLIRLKKNLLVINYKFNEHLRFFCN